MILGYKYYVMIAILLILINLSTFFCVKNKKDSIPLILTPSVGVPIFFLISEYIFDLLDILSTWRFILIFLVGVLSWRLTAMVTRPEFKSLSCVGIIDLLNLFYGAALVSEPMFRGVMIIVKKIKGIPDISGKIYVKVKIYGRQKPGGGAYIYDVEVPESRKRKMFPEFKRNLIATALRKHSEQGEGSDLGQMGEVKILDSKSNKLKELQSWRQLRKNWDSIVVVPTPEEVDPTKEELVTVYDSLNTTQKIATVNLYQPDGNIKSFNQFKWEIHKSMDPTGDDEQSFTKQADNINLTCAAKRISVTNMNILQQCIEEAKNKNIDPEIRMFKSRKQSVKDIQNITFEVRDYLGQEISSVQIPNLLLTEYEYKFDYYGQAIDKLRDALGADEKVTNYINSNPVKGLDDLFITYGDTNKRMNNSQDFHEMVSTSETNKPTIWILPKSPEILEVIVDKQSVMVPVGKNPFAAIKQKVLPNNEMFLYYVENLEESGVGPLRNDDEIKKHYRSYVMRRSKNQTALFFALSKSFEQL